MTAQVKRRGLSSHHRPANADNDAGRGRSAGVLCQRLTLHRNGRQALPADVSHGYRHQCSAVHDTGRTTTGSEGVLVCRQVIAEAKLQI